MSITNIVVEGIPPGSTSKRGLTFTLIRFQDQVLVLHVCPRYYPHPLGGYNVVRTGVAGRRVAQVSEKEAKAASQTQSDHSSTIISFLFGLVCLRLDPVGFFSGKVSSVHIIFPLPAPS